MADDYRICNKCYKLKRRDQFYVRRERVSGVLSMCAACCRIGHKERNCSERGALYQLLYSSRRHYSVMISRRRDIGKYTIDHDQLTSLYDDIQKGYCYWHPKRIMSLITHDSWHISIDRSDPTLSYIIDNVRLCCAEFNIRKTWSHHKIDTMIRLVDIPIEPRNWVAYLTGPPRSKTRRAKCVIPTHQRIPPPGRGCRTCTSISNRALADTPYGYLSKIVRAAVLRGLAKK